ncbi:hypothetical protein CVIRNUC_007203 [Coccomyxa viridis]|uniref:FHA domain-containing protein n=1 Tax=Coccomyxa viridis TaxID=1274662 RepID=A0AAV1IBV0_9CHLO|nr:hypothetical protein CVIRNUC_007203 [Coccomyxa viridis]
MQEVKHGAPAAPAALELEAVSGPCKGSAFTKSGTVLTVGRTKAGDIHIKDSAVSERHAELRWQESKWTLTDVGSSNGTVLNGRKLLEGEPADLKHGDVVLFGSDSQVKVSLTPFSDESTTVEQHLRLECEMLMQRVRAQAEQHANELLNQWSSAKKALLAASA